jgi:exopolysaccharide production protein ExoQ
MFPLAYFASSGIFWFDGGESNSRLATTYGALVVGETRPPDHTLTLLLLFGATAVALLPTIISVAKFYLADKVFAALVGWAAVSCLWSQAPSDSLKTTIYVALNTIFAFYLYRRFTPHQQLRLLIMLGWLCLAISIPLALFFPRYGIDYTLIQSSWKGMYGQKNLCSMATSFLMVGALYSPSRSVWFNVSRVAFIVLSVFLILMTQSGTGKICLAVIAAHYLFTRYISTVPLEKRKVVLGVVTISVLSCLGLGFALAPTIARLLGKDLTLTGRTDIWQSVIPTILQRPMLGYGYCAFWRGYSGASASISLANHWAVSSAHNAFLEVWLNLGLIGVVLVLVSILRAVRDAYICIRGGNSPYIFWCTCIVLLTIVTSADEGELMVPNNLMWILYILACIGLSEGAKRIRLGLDHG